MHQALRLAGLAALNVLRRSTRDLYDTVMADDHRPHGFRHSLAALAVEAREALSHKLGVPDNAPVLFQPRAWALVPGEQGLNLLKMTLYAEMFDFITGDVVVTRKPVDTVIDAPSYTVVVTGGSNPVVSVFRASRWVRRQSVLDDLRRRAGTRTRAQA